MVEDLQFEVLWLRDPDGVVSQKVRIADLSSLAVGVPNSPGTGAVHGAVFGAVAGSIHPGERWESIPLKAGLGASMARDGTVRLGIAFSVAGGVGK